MPEHSSSLPDSHEQLHLHATGDLGPETETGREPDSVEGLRRRAGAQTAAVRATMGEMERLGEQIAKHQQNAL